MVKGNVIDNFDTTNILNIENILKKVTAYDIYKFYTPFSFKLGQSFKSPFRSDKNPSFSIKQSKTTGEIYHLDYAKSKDGGNCFQYVKKMYNCNFNEALEHINSDFGLGLNRGIIKDYKSIITTYEQPEKITRYKRIDVFTRKMNHEELAYWAKRFITEDELNKNYIFGINVLLLDGQKITNPKHMLRFAYYFPKRDKWKIYTPYADKSKGEFKWISNLSIEVIECLNLLIPDKNCLGSKSRKDRIINQKFIPETFSTQNEAEVSISPENIDYILTHSKHCYLFFDNDTQGVKSCQYYNTFGLDYINIPKELGVKDTDEFVVRYGLDAYEFFLKNNKII